jgi:hypothetical protein
MAINRGLNGVHIMSNSMIGLAGNLNMFRDMVFALAVEKGWYDSNDGNGPSFAEQIALIHSELSEALEDYRNGSDPKDVVWDASGKPSGIPTELADTIIRCLDLAGRCGIDIGQAVVDKHVFNSTRPYRHGGKKL